MTEMTADGPGSGEIPMDAGAMSSPNSRIFAALLPLLMLDAVLVIVVVVAIMNWPPPGPLWVIAGIVVFMGVFYMVRVLPRKMRRVRAQREGRAATYAVRLPRGDWVWSISGFGSGGVESIRVAAIGGAGGVYTEGNDPEPNAWCLDAVTGSPIEPTRTAQGRAEDQSGWAYEPSGSSDPQLFLTIDRARAHSDGVWAVRIGVVRADGSAPERLLIQRLSPSEAQGLRPT